MGTASATATHSRRFMSKSSSLGPWSSVTSSGLQRHAADRARARPFLADLRMHGAGVDRALGISGTASAGFGGCR